MSERYPRSSEMTRERILDSASELFSHRGIEAVSVREVAKAASVSHALVHTYFGSKTDLVEAVLARDLEGFGHVLQAAEGADASSADVFQAVARHAMDNKRSVMLFLRAQMDGYEPHRFLCPDKMALGVLADRLKEALPADRLSTDKLDPRAAIATIGAAGFGMAAAMQPLMAAVGLQNENPKAFEEHIIDFMSQMLQQCFVCDVDEAAAS